MHYLKTLPLIIILFFFICCNKNSEFITKMDKIKLIGDSNPSEALFMLDSLEIGIREENDEYLQMKYDLLKIRLQDKAYITHTSDILIKKVMQFFDAKGSDKEKQEAYYYGGSVYRDLQDTPRSLEYFYKSAEIAATFDECDSIMLSNTYSQISYLLWAVQDYNRANEFALKEYRISKRLNRININTLMHLGVSYQCMGEIQSAKKWLDKAYYKLLESDSVTDYVTIYNLIYNYSQIRDFEQAKKCYLLSMKLPEDSTYQPKYLNLGKYFEMTNQTDSAIFYYNHIINESNNILRRFDAARDLFVIYKDRKELGKATYYADIFKNASDTLDFGMRQELAATISNQYQYHLDKEKEQKLKDEKDRMHYMIIILTIASIMVISLLGFLLIYRKNRNLKRMLALSNELDEIKNSKEKLLHLIDSKEQELGDSKNALENAQNELEYVKEKLNQVSLEVEEQNEELRKKEKQLEERIKQNRTYINLLNQSYLEGKAEDVIQSIRQTTRGRRNMTAADWKQLYQSVNELHPDFHDQLISKLDKLTEQQMQVCYLMKIGLTNLQIQNMTNLSRVTVWRWVKKYNWIITKDEGSG